MATGQQKKKKKKKKVIRYRRPRNINIGMIFFAFIFVYMLYSVYTYMHKVKIQFYEVVEGSIVSDKTYTGIILRDEQTQSADSSGYINYYIREGKRASVGTKIYSIDETGNVEAALTSKADDQAELQDDDLKELKKQLTSYSLSYSDMKFSSLYDIKYSLDASVLEYVNFNTLDSISDLSASLGGNFKQYTSPSAGVVSYAIDSYETMKPEEISASSFDRTTYQKAITKSGQLIEAGAPVYKIIPSDTWSIVFPLSDKDLELYGQETSLKISFSGSSLETTGSFSVITGSDGAKYGQLNFDKYMVQFVSDRFVDFEILSEKVTGLKIPISAVTSKTFYTVPADYLTSGGDSQDTGFYKEIYDKDGTSMVFVSTEIYYQTDESCYISTNEDAQIKAGDYIIKPNSTERYQVGATASLQGVYNINKGYTVFKQIEILSSNPEYYTVRKGMRYGLSVYDHIILDASIVQSEGELVYQ